MARSRNIKPGFFVNDELAEIEPIGRLLFIGLWTIADREGRLKDRPKKIKAQVLPFDDCDVDGLLNELEEKGFILRYMAGSCGYIQIINFGKHQNPHVKEQASEIPAPDMHHASTGQEQDMHGSCPPDSLNLIPDSLVPSNNSKIAFAEVKKEIKTSMAKLKELHRAKIYHGDYYQKHTETFPAYRIIQLFNHIPPEKKVGELARIYMDVFPEQKKYGTAGMAKANDSFKETLEMPTCAGPEEILKEIVYAEGTSLSPWDIKGRFKNSGYTYTRMKYEIDEAHERGALNENQI